MPRKSRKSARHRQRRVQPTRKTIAASRRDYGRGPVQDAHAAFTTPLAVRRQRVPVAATKFTSLAFTCLAPGLLAGPVLSAFVEDLQEPTRHKLLRQTDTRAVAGDGEDTTGSSGGAGETASRSMPLAQQVSEAMKAADAANTNTQPSPTPTSGDRSGPSEPTPLKTLPLNPMLHSDSLNVASNSTSTSDQEVSAVVPQLFQPAASNATQNLTADPEATSSPSLNYLVFIIVAGAFAAAVLIGIWVFRKWKLKPSTQLDPEIGRGYPHLVERTRESDKLFLRELKDP